MGGRLFHLGFSVFDQMDREAKLGRLKEKRVDTSNSQVIILGAAEGQQGGFAAAATDVGPNRCALDWLLEAFKVLPNAEIFFVSGYQHAVLMDKYPQVRFVFNPHWATTGPLQSLALVPVNKHSSTYVCYGDVVFRQEVVTQLAENESDFVVAIDQDWQTRYDQRNKVDIIHSEKVVLEDGHVSQIGKSIAVNEASAEFAGVFKCSSSYLQDLKGMLTSGFLKDKQSLPDFISQYLRVDGGVSYVNIKSQWAELNAPQDIARFVLGTKSESLARIRPLLRHSSVCEIFSPTYEEWCENPSGTCEYIRKLFQGKNLIVRSSAVTEDGWTKSNAGAYLSIPNVRTGQLEVLKAVIEKVFDSYGTPTLACQVLIQPMLENVKTCGVVMTRTHGDNAPYYVVNFDDTTGGTDAVTSGKGDVRTLYIHRSRLGSEDFAEFGFNNLRDALLEIEEIVGHDSLDIEFAITEDAGVHLLQVRPIVASAQRRASDRQILAGLKQCAKFLAERQKAPVQLLGDSTYLSVMADWNPAEIIGVKPKPLSFALYRYIITDETWATQRAEYGYRDIRPCNLLVDLLGHPYIDVRACFNSFIPADLSDSIATKLVSYYLTKLRESPELHDKVEFDILFTCGTFDTREQLTAAADNIGLDRQEVEAVHDALLAITQHGIDRTAADYTAIERVNDSFNRVMGSSPPTLEKIFQLLDRTRSNGALLFSHLARSAFVAVTLLKSLCRKGVISQHEMAQFLGSIRTVSSEFNRDSYLTQTKKMDFVDYVNKYGHLRPGTYSITSQCYGKSPDEYLRPTVKSAKLAPELEEEVWGPSVKSKIETALQDLGLNCSVEQFCQFLRDSIAGREYCKFIFTKYISTALEQISDIGEEAGLDRDGMSYLHIQDILQLRNVEHRSAYEILEPRIRERKAAYRLTKAVRFPDMIFDEKDIYQHEQHAAMPNYVTSKKVRAETVNLDGMASQDVDLEGKIVVIPNADPGYDYLFSRNVAGIITAYGGVNSHMAIRAGEFQLPAAIGVGQKLFQFITRAKVIELDCSSGQILALE